MVGQLSRTTGLSAPAYCTRDTLTHQVKHAAVVCPARHAHRRPGATGRCGPLADFDPQTVGQRNVQLTWGEKSLNPLDSEGNCSATSNNTKLVHWPLMGGLLYLVQRSRRCLVGCGPAQSPPPRCTKCNSPPINGQCTNRYIAIWWFVALRF